jgi:hypothetical protein
MRFSGLPSLLALLGVAGFLMLQGLLGSGLAAFLGV